MEKKRECNAVTNKNNDSENDPGGTSLAQTNPTGSSYTKIVTCFCCGKTGHFANKCDKYETTDREDWVIKLPVDKGKVGKEKKVNWSGTQVQYAHTDGWSERPLILVSLRTRRARYQMVHAHMAHRIPN